MARPLRPYPLSSLMAIGTFFVVFKKWYFLPYLYISISLYIFLYLCIYHYISVSIYISLYLSIYLCIYHYISVSIYISLYLSIYLCIYLYISVSIYISLYISLYLSPSVYFYRYLLLSSCVVVCCVKYKVLSINLDCCEKNNKGKLVWRDFSLSHTHSLMNESSFISE